MKTWCNTEIECPAEVKAQLDKIEDALGDLVTTHDNPCGGAAYYDEGEAKPWRVLYCDGVDESFATAEEAIDSAADYAQENS